MSILENYLTEDELATELNVCTRTLARWCQKNDGLPFVKMGKRRIFKRDTVVGWLDNQEIFPNPSRRARS